MNPETASSSPLAVFREYLAQGKLAFQFDAALGRPVFPPRVIGPGSGTADLEWRISEGLGTVYAVTIISPRGEAPYNVVLVDMDEGFRLMSRVEGLPPGEVRIGMRVRVDVCQPQDGQAPYPVFRPEVP
ncbi:OB-fold domain-containing protein [Pigmentiphaga sp.]|jgi:Predicted nucleic-acid-binding protein containing a Zn-ribbon|uniref:Zn-ribbon domain-containing OB-fold protein n=1 Tax=Pigmentiphaga sp. TaxID=1977564 RepID=UPI0025F020E8|nr:OB-fold domain-containing protein [Pigmentiphaga sp.]MBX6319909.1 OB-fold domain-containing protein [Pigmentiphaga sp.]